MRVKAGGRPQVLCDSSLGCSRQGGPGPRVPTDEAFALMAVVAVAATATATIAPSVTVMAVHFWTGCSPRPRKKLLAANRPL